MDKQLAVNQVEVSFSIVAYTKGKCELVYEDLHARGLLGKFDYCYYDDKHGRKPRRAN